MQYDPFDGARSPQQHWRQLEPYPDRASPQRQRYGHSLRTPFRIRDSQLDSSLVDDDRLQDEQRQRQQQQQETRVPLSVSTTTASSLLLSPITPTTITPTTISTPTTATATAASTKTATRTTTPLSTPRPASALSDEAAARLAIPPPAVGLIRVQERQTGQQGLFPGGCPAPQPAERRWRP